MYFRSQETPKCSSNLRKHSNVNPFPENTNMLFSSQKTLNCNASLRKHPNVIPFSYLCCRLAQISACKTLSQRWNSSPPEIWLLTKAVLYYNLNLTLFIFCWQKLFKPLFFLLTKSFLNLCLFFVITSNLIKLLRRPWTKCYTRQTRCN